MQVVLIFLVKEIWLNNKDSLSRLLSSFEGNDYMRDEIKKITSIILVVLTILSFSACGEDDAGNAISETTSDDYIEESKTEVLFQVENPNKQTDFYTALNLNFAEEDGRIYFCDEGSGGSQIRCIDFSEDYDYTVVFDYETQEETMKSLLVQNTHSYTIDKNIATYTDDIRFLQVINGWAYWADAYNIWRARVECGKSQTMRNLELVATTGTPGVCLASPFYIVGDTLYTFFNSFSEQTSSDKINVSSRFCSVDLETKQFGNLPETAYRICDVPVSSTTKEENQVPYQEIIMAFPNAIYFVEHGFSDASSNVKVLSLSDSVIKDTSLSRTDSVFKEDYSWVSGYKSFYPSTNDSLFSFGGLVFGGDNKHILFQYYGKEYHLLDKDLNIINSYGYVDNDENYLDNDEKTIIAQYGDSIIVSNGDTNETYVADLKQSNKTVFLNEEVDNGKMVDDWFYYYSDDGLCRKNIDTGAWESLAWLSVR